MSTEEAFSGTGHLKEATDRARDRADRRPGQMADPLRTRSSNVPAGVIPWILDTSSGPAS